MTDAGSGWDILGVCGNSVAMSWKPEMALMCRLDRTPCLKGGLSKYSYAAVRVLVIRSSGTISVTESKSKLTVVQIYPYTSAYSHIYNVEHTLRSLWRKPTSSSRNRGQQICLSQSKNTTPPKYLCETRNVPNLFEAGCI
jgi:hypothetical protein